MFDSHLKQATTSGWHRRSQGPTYQRHNKKMTASLLTQDHALSLSLSVNIFIYRMFKIFYDLYISTYIRWLYIYFHSFLRCALYMDILEDLSYLSNTKPLSSSHSNNLCILVPWMRGFFATPCAVRTVGVAGKPPEAASTRMITINCVLVEVVEWLECQLDGISRSQIYVHSGRILSTTSIASTDCQACSIYRLFSKLLALKMFLRFSSFPLSISSVL